MGGWLIVAGAAWAAAAAPPSTSHLERSYWVHASLGASTQRGYWGTNFPAAAAPSGEEITKAAGLFSSNYGANRLYLIYHGEIPAPEARRVFRDWRSACPPAVELVPALVLRMYDRAQTPVFTSGEVRDLCAFFRDRIHSDRAAVYDVYRGRDQGGALAEMARSFPRGLIRLGLQPDEVVAAPFATAVQDTWSGFCHGARNREDWEQPGFGAPALRRWVEARNAGSAPIAWNLIAVAWDYTATPRGGYPGYDDAAKNMPLPSGRNAAGAALVAGAATRDTFGGFSCDLCILNENSRHPAHDGPAGAFYRTLREGRDYTGFYAVPLREIADLYRRVADTGLGALLPEPPRTGP